MKAQGDKGFIGTIILVIIGLAALKYFFDWDVFDAANTEEGQGTIAYIRNIFDFIWNIIGTPVEFIWNNIIWPLLGVGWDNFFAFIEWSRTAAEAGAK